MARVGRRFGSAAPLVVLLLLVSAVSCNAADRAIAATSPVIAAKSEGPTIAGEVKVNPRDGAEMVWIPPGEFVMGSTPAEVSAALKGFPERVCRDIADFLLQAECPQRKVEMDGYWMYKCEVTVAQYRKFCEATGGKLPNAPDGGWKDSHPIVDVSWDDANAYAKWAGASLPSEAQWEKAARGTDGCVYPWGNDWDASRCANSVEKSMDGPAPVCGYPKGASPYGCLDMAGNVWEWCADWYDPAYYKSAPSKNPRGPAEAVKFQWCGPTVRGARALRGGSWYYDNNIYFRCASRSYHQPTSRDRDDGFRCVVNQ